MATDADITRALEARLTESPELRELRDQCFSTVSEKAGGSYQIAVILIISLISVAIQILTYCRNKPKEELLHDIRNIRSLPPRKLMRLRRRLNVLWRNNFGGEPSRTGRETNPLMAAAFEMGETANDAALDELFKLAGLDK